MCRMLPALPSSYRRQAWQLQRMHACVARHLTMHATTCADGVPGSGAGPDAQGVTLRRRCSASRCGKAGK
jgi:hypothetical protein